jgi:hypothetical protein
MGRKGLTGGWVAAIVALSMCSLLVQTCTGTFVWAAAVGVRDQTNAAEQDRKIKEQERAAARERAEAERKLAASQPRKEWVCKITVPNSDTGYVPLFPDEDGVSSGIEAMSSIRETGDLARFVANTGAIMVARGTRCSWIDLGVFGPSKVRVLEGTHAGRVGWTRTEWVRVEEVVSP